MQSHHLELLRCPLCHMPLYHHHGTWRDGMVYCHNNHAFPIHKGVLDLRTQPNPAMLAAQSNDWALTAWAYERMWRPYALSILSGERFPYTREMPLICQRLANPRVIVDIACSNGLYARQAAIRYPGARVLGFDRSLPMLQEAVRRARRYNLDIGYVCADARDLPLHSQQAHAILIGGSWNEMEDIPAVLAELTRIRAPHAQLRSMGLIQADQGLAARIQPLLGRGGVHFPTHTQLPEWLTTHGWQIEWQHIYGTVQFIQARVSTTNA